MIIEDISEFLNKIPDKFENRWTTSKKFKIELYETFNTIEFKEKRCVELGSYNGHTTALLCNLFKHVTGFELEQKHIDESIHLLEENNIKNYTIIQTDLYNGNFPVLEETDVFFIDAVHQYNNVKIDTINCLNTKSKSKKHIIYDDYGAFPDIKKFVDEFVSNGTFSIYRKIGYEPNSNFTRKLHDYEGVICIEN